MAAWWRSARALSTNGGGGGHPDSTRGRERGERWTELRKAAGAWRAADLRPSPPIE